MRKRKRRSRNKKWREDKEKKRRNQPREGSKNKTHLRFFLSFPAEDKEEKIVEKSHEIASHQKTVRVVCSGRERGE